MEYEDYPRRQASPAAGSYSYGYGGRCPASSDNDPNMPCVANRLKQFDRSIHQLLNPETRRMDTTRKARSRLYLPNVRAILSHGTSGLHAVLAACVVRPVALARALGDRP